MMAEPPDLPFRDDVLVENGDVSPKSCLPPLEMRTTTAAGGFLPTGETSTVTKITFNKSPLRLYATEEVNSKERKLWTSTAPVWYDGSSFRRKKLLAAPSCQRVIETKSRQNRTFDPDGSQGRLRACPFWERGARCFVVGLCVLGQLDETAALFKGSTRFNAVHIAVNWLVLCSLAGLKLLCQKKSCRRERLQATGGTNGGHAVEGGSR